MKKTKSRKRLFLMFEKVFGKTNAQRIGSTMILFAVCALFYIYYPLIQLFIPQSHLDIHSDNRITIPKIGVVAPITWDVDPFNEKEYRKVLKNSVAHAKGTSYPGKVGTTYIFAHSSDFPWELTRYNVIFFRLGELKQGDKITVTKNKKDYIYMVSKLRTVWPNQVQYLTNSTKTQLILQTCTPVGTSLMRLLVFADPI